MFASKVLHAHRAFSFQGFQTSIIINKINNSWKKLKKVCQALVPYVIYMSTSFYPKITSFTSYSVAHAQTYICYDMLKI